MQIVHCGILLHLQGLLTIWRKTFVVARFSFNLQGSFCDFMAIVIQSEHEIEQLPTSYVMHSAVFILLKEGKLLQMLPNPRKPRKVSTADDLHYTVSAKGLLVVSINLDGFWFGESQMIH